MTIELDAVVEAAEDAPPTCYYCGSDDQDFATTVEVTTVRPSTYEEVRRSHVWSYYGNPEMHVALSEREVAHITENAGGSWKFDYQERHVCLDCVRHCDWCETPYVLPQASDNTFDVGRSDYIRLNRLVWSHMDKLCRSCSDDSYTCDYCGIALPSHDTFTLGYDNTYCETCYEDNTEYCDDCEDRFPAGHMEECQVGVKLRIRNYSYKPEPDFKWIVEVDGDLSDNRTFQGTPFLGMELEVEVEDYIGSALDVVESAFGRLAYCKEDGSIEHGFEIVTHPMTLAAHKRLVDWNFGSELSRLGVRSWNTRTCGLHVHISRSAFRGKVHMLMFQHLFINNEIEMSRLAGRNSERWASFSGVRDVMHKRMKNPRHYAENRYEAVNMTNDDTLEIRIFRGSLRAERVLMALELVEAAYQYTRNMTSRDYQNTDGAHFYYFAQWVRGNEKYTNLNYYIDHYNLLENLPPSMAQVESN